MLSLMYRFLLHGFVFWSIITVRAQDCTKPLPDGQAVGSTSNVTITSGGLERSYLINIPPGYLTEPSVPVILSFHGGGRNAVSQLELDQFTNPEFDSGAIVVYPQGLDDTWVGILGNASVDLQFTSDVIDQLEALYCIDLSRIWASGKSDGGGWCNTLACDPQLSMRIAAFAPVSGAFYVDTLPCRPTTVSFPCNPGRPDIPMLEFHGGKDSTIEYLGRKRKSECLPTIPHWIQSWALRDELSDINTTTHITSDTLKYTYGSGPDTGLVTHIFDSVIGHDWPSTATNDDNKRSGHHPASFNATPIIIEFFQRYASNGTSRKRRSPRWRELETLQNKIIY